MLQKNKLSIVHDNNPTDAEITVVMIHGIASDASTYNHALEHLESDSDLKRVRFITFDLLGSGTSYSGDELEYDYDDQLTALDNAISELKINTPIVLMGHSLGTFIVTRYASLHPDVIKQLILISPPVYTEKDFDNPAFMEGIEMFKKAVSAKNPEILEEKSFKNSMKKIVLDKKNYKVLSGIKTPTILIYGDEDQLIASFNIPGLIRESENISAIKTHGRHGVTKDKYEEIAKILKGASGAR